MFKKYAKLLVVLFSFMCVSVIIPSHSYSCECDGLLGSPYKDWQMMYRQGTSLMYRTCNNGSDTFYVDFKNPNDYDIVICVAEIENQSLWLNITIPCGETKSFTTHSNSGFVNWRFFAERKVQE